MSSGIKQAKKIILPVTGMTCASCVATIEKGLSKLTGVTQVNVNLASEKASIEYDSSKVDTKALMETIKDSRSISDVSHGVERAAIVTQVAEKNAWVKDMQYWNNSLFDIWIPDTVDALRPLK